MKLVQFLPLVIEDYEDGVQHFPKHSHTYYELIYIHSGAGTHILNEKPFLYSAGDVYLISPADHHVFEVETVTHFTIIKFTFNYITMHPAFNADLKLPDRIKEMMHNVWIKYNKIQLKGPYSQIIKRTIMNMIDAQRMQLSLNDAWIYHQFLSLIDIVRSNIYQTLGKQPPSAHMDHLIDYIHENIYQPELLLIKNIANRFHISESYFSNFFKKTYGQSYRDYSQNYKINLIENRLMNSNTNIKKIAKEFGFHDSSHFHQFYKSMRGDSPINFRKKNCD
ncbi:AraC family transcriptional regulator [Pedobacter sp. L105]|uniref:helix-turn-helix domain-containing protein n=1 Tax=Pedobacter sp. L105 TaxID=1641871 RepID=UPI00131AE2DF|nr:AraC family transcriptional regulator [Pedobacter sp. L105]